MPKRNQRNPGDVRARGYAALLAVVVACGASDARAQTIGDGRAVLYAGMERSDNPTQISTDDASATIAAVGIKTNLMHDGNKLDYGAIGDLGWARYSNDVFSSSTHGEIDAFANWGADDDILRWTLRDTLNHSRQNAAGNSTPDNLEVVNTVATGPVVTVPLGSANVGMMKALYSRQMYSHSFLDADNLSGEVALVHELSGRSNVGIHATYASTAYADDLANTADFDTYEYFFNYQSTGARFNIRADVGYAKVRGDGVSSEGPLLRLRLERRMTERSSVVLSAAQQHTSAALLAQTAPVGDFLGGGATPLSIGGSMKTRSVDAMWQLHGRRTELQLLGELGREEFATASQFDRTEFRVQASIQRALRTNLSALLSAQYRRENLALLGVPDPAYKEYQFSIEQNIGRRLGLSTFISYVDRNDTGSVYQFSEMRYGIRLQYLLTRDGA
jgi:hypothetical protein